MKTLGIILKVWGYVLMVAWIGMIPHALTTGTGYLDTWSYLAGVIAAPILLVFLGNKLRKAKHESQTH
jgi:hypothetical protein